ncbi:hypothetical protein [Curtobacterium herbarum]|uniref:hypothetical protein n=1 Tax=Curtobacterium herbarum TaxID=150122 RepID=UPI00195C1E15|nr:hypothetical protein [Curtobacterium herbarum]MBM7476882.1 hypothetical protein [Curtobacterium herbarum]MCS6545107.1 hypothetical protein [Curtobacterium herbarum]
MKDIHYAGRAIRTTDGAADAVIRYAAVLGGNGKTDTIDVPTFDDEGRPAVETLLLGPASLITVSSAVDDLRAPAIDDAGFVEHVRRLAVLAGPVRPVHEDPEVQAEGLGGFD